MITLIQEGNPCYGDLKIEKNGMLYKVFRFTCGWDGPMSDYWVQASNGFLFHFLAKWKLKRLKKRL